MATDVGVGELELGGLLDELEQGRVEAGRELLGTFDGDVHREALGHLLGAQDAAADGCGGLAAVDLPGLGQVVEAVACNGTRRLTPAG